MLIALGLAAGLVAGAPLPHLAVLGLAAWQPVWVLVAVGLWTVLGRPPQVGINAEAAVLQGVTAELRAGAGLRQALAAAAERVPGPDLSSVARCALAGRPLDEVAEALRAALPRLGSLAASALRAAGSTGGRAADAFESLALIAVEETELIRERRVATAQVRFSAWIVGGIPVAYLIYAAATGRLAAVRSSGGAGVIVVTLGSAFLIGGVAAVWALVRRASR